MPPYDVFFYEAFSEEANAIQRYLPATLHAGFSEKTPQVLGYQKFPPAPIISIRTQSQIPESWMNSLKGILSRSTGYDHLLKFKGQKISLGHLPFYCSQAVAEQALMLVLALLRQLPKQLKQWHHFYRNGLTGQELSEQSIAVIGVGKIGYEIYKILKVLNVDVVGIDLEQRYSDVDYLTLKKALNKSHGLICAMNLTSENKGYFGNHFWDAIPHPLWLVNISRGELTPSLAIKNAFESKKLTGFASDVYEHEKWLGDYLRGELTSLPPKLMAELKTLKELSQRSDVIFTPHNAFNTKEAVERKSAQSIESILHWQEKGQFKWPVV